MGGSGRILISMSRLLSGGLGRRRSPFQHGLGMGKSNTDEGLDLPCLGSGSLMQ
jgi:hypothetical protein